jgi:hypothetical protein
VRCNICDSRCHAQTKSKDWIRADGSPGHYEQVVYRCPAEHGMVGEKKIIKHLSAYLTQLEEEAFRLNILRNEPVSIAAELTRQIDALNKRLDKLSAGVTQADMDYYGHGALDEDAPRHQAIVNGIKKQMTLTQAEITQLQDRLHENELHAQRSQRVEDLRLDGLAYLDSEDTRSANAWLRVRMEVIIEGRKVIGVAVL